MRSRRRIEEQRRSIDEIRAIMHSMKTLAHMEMQKLGRLVETQHQVVAGIEAVATDFVNAFPETLPEIQSGREVWLLIGSERGFCGDFNNSLLQQLESEKRHWPDAMSCHLIAVGHKLYPLPYKETCRTEYLQGANVAEEVSSVLADVVALLDGLQNRHGALGLSIIYHTGESHQAISRRLLPPFQANRNQAEIHTIAPDLNLKPGDFLVELSDHYLYAALHEIFYTSLMAENHNRVQHLEGAVKHLEEKSEGLKRQSNARRQEEIIEEIEVILLNAANLKTPSIKQ